MAWSTDESSLCHAEGGYYDPDTGTVYIATSGVHCLTSNYELLTQLGKNAKPLNIKNENEY